MNIDIGNFNLTSDKHNVIVHVRYTKEDQSEGLRFVGYYGTVQAALHRLLDANLKQTDAQSVFELLDEIERHKKDIEQLVASVDFEAYRQEVPQNDLGFLD